MAYISSFAEYIKLNQVLGKKKCLTSHSYQYTKDIHGVLEREICPTKTFLEVAAEEKDRMPLELSRMTGKLLMSHKKKWSKT